MSDPIEVHKLSRPIPLRVLTCDDLGRALEVACWGGWCGGEGVARVGGDGTVTACEQCRVIGKRIERLLSDALDGGVST